MNTYFLFKSLHLIAVISWMAGLLYLPRIFVYHSENVENLNSSNIFKVMEKRLFYYIMTPAMILSWIFGIILIFTLYLIISVSVSVSNSLYSFSNIFLARPDSIALSV